MQCGYQRFLIKKSRAWTGLYLQFAAWFVCISPPTRLGLLILGIFSSPCCVDVVAKLGHVLGDVASANLQGNTGRLASPSPGAFSVHVPHFPNIALG